MIAGNLYLQTHCRADVAMLHELWSRGVPASEIAVQMGVAQSTVGRWAQHYKLPERPPCEAQQEPPAPTPEDDAASLAGLALSPWVEERAKKVRERHFANKLREANDTIRTGGGHV